jgi:hypothetical protein
MAEITSETIFRVAELHRTIKEQAGEIERLRALLEGYEAMEKTMKREVSQ